MRTTTYKAAAMLVAATIALVHLLIAATVDLSVDEAHYGLYARFLDWSYFDHPPMVGWLLWLLTPLGLNEFTLRLPSATIYLLCSYLIYHIAANKLAGGCALKGLLALVLFSVTPMVQLLGFGLVPEFPLLLWALLIALLVDHLHSDSELKYWLGLGLLFGLAGLTKYTAVLLVAGVACYWLLQGQLLSMLKQRRLYLAVAVTLVVISPVFIWNYRHDWASFNYQLNHAAGGEWEIGEVIRALAVQLLTYSPVLLAGGLVALKNISHAGMGGLLVCLASPVLLFVIVSSGNGSSLPHWSLLGWSLLAPAVSHWLVDNWQRPSIRRLAYFGNGFALAVSVLLLIILAFKPLGTLPWAAVALRDLSGWKQAAAIASELGEELAPDNGVILVSNWSQASRIAWYAWPRTVQVLDHRPGQFVYWYGAPDTTTQGVLIRDNIDDDEDPTTPYIKMGLQCNYLQHYADSEDGKIINHFYFYFCQSATPDAKAI
jgi:4-amino-4-deoxy-L-arabinose transferase-like glycosyltransferase